MGRETSAASASECKLAGSPVKSCECDSNRFLVQVIPGHAEGAGRTIEFKLVRNARGIVFLEVRAWETDVTRCDRIRACAALNRKFKQALWDHLAFRVAMLRI